VRGRVDTLSEMEKRIMRYAASGTIVMADALSRELAAPWPSIEYALNKLIAAGLMQEDLPFIYSLTSEGRKSIADSQDAEQNNG
jgi:Mn-dependent DtxR family transcriptional regulator